MDKVRLLPLFAAILHISLPLKCKTRDYFVLQDMESRDKEEQRTDTLLFYR